MADATWTVRTSPTWGGTFTAIGDVQSVDMNFGRAKITDQWRPSTCSITGTDASNVSGLQINDYLEIYADSNSNFWFRISDISIQYDIVANGDNWQIQGEAALAGAGRSVADQTLAAGSYTLDAAAQLLTDAPVTVAHDQGWSTIDKIDVLKTNPMPVFQTLLQMEQGYVQDFKWGTAGGATPDKLSLYERGSLGSTVNVSFVDDGSTPSSINLKYERIEFNSAGQDYVSGVVVDPAGHAAQTSGTIERAYTLNTYDETATQAANLAGYLVAALSQVAATPASITTNFKTWPNLNPLIYLFPGVPINVKLRGSTYQCLLEGMSINGTPGQTRMTLRFSPATVYNLFTLDDPVLGKLDSSFALLGF